MRAQTCSYVRRWRAGGTSWIGTKAEAVQIHPRFVAERKTRYRVVRLVGASIRALGPRNDENQHASTRADEARNTHMSEGKSGDEPPRLKRRETLCFSLTRKRSAVRARQRPPRESPLSTEGSRCSSGELEDLWTTFGPRETRFSLVRGGLWRLRRALHRDGRRRRRRFGCSRDRADLRCILETLRGRSASPRGCGAGRGVCRVAPPKRPVQAIPRLGRLVASGSTR